MSAELASCTHMPQPLAACQIARPVHSTPIHTGVCSQRPSLSATVSAAARTDCITEYYDRYVIPFVSIRTQFQLCAARPRSDFYDCSTGTAPARGETRRTRGAAARPTRLNFE